MNARLQARVYRSQRRERFARSDPGRWVVPIIAASLIVLFLLRVWP